jgi:hypothetical protein
VAKNRSPLNLPSTLALQQIRLTALDASVLADMKEKTTAITQAAVVAAAN